LLFFKSACTQCHQFLGLPLNLFSFWLIIEDTLWYSICIYSLLMANPIQSLYSRSLNMFSNYYIFSSKCCLFCCFKHQSKNLSFKTSKTFCYGNFLWCLDSTLLLVKKTNYYIHSVDHIAERCVSVNMRRYHVHKCCIVVNVKQ